MKRTSIMSPFVLAWATYAFLTHEPKEPFIRIIGAILAFLTIFSAILIINGFILDKKCSKIEKMIENRENELKSDEK